jgi:hypothetical protein
MLPPSLRLTYEEYGFVQLWAILIFTGSKFGTGSGGKMVHNIVVAGTFLAMIFCPCLVAMRSGIMDKELD